MMSQEDQDKTHLSLDENLKATTKNLEILDAQSSTLIKIVERLDKIDGRVCTLDQNIGRHDLAIFGGRDLMGTAHNGLQTQVIEAVSDIKAAKEDIGKMHDSVKMGVQWVASTCVTLIFTIVATFSSFIWFLITHADKIAGAFAVLSHKP